MLHQPRTISRRFPFISGIALLFLCGTLGTAMAATLCVNPRARSGCMATIGAAVAAASPGDTIQVARGVYKEDVKITKSLSLVGQDHQQPVIDATGLPNGILVDGSSAAPNVGVANVLISGFTVQNANFEGILVKNASDVTIVGNHVHDNDQSLDIADHSCPGIPSFETNEGDDCGEGIHLIATSHSSVVRNESAYNSGGILLSDETGPTRGNLISGNNVHDNPYDCGITMASHAPAIPSPVSFGVVHNTIANNISEHNGYELPGAGAGVGIFAPGPGSTAARNVVIDNELLNNGQAGVALHNHAAVPAPAPPVDFNGNEIVGNYFSGNAADSNLPPGRAASGPTGIDVNSIAPIYGTVISQNVFENEAFAVVFNAPSGLLSVHFNDFGANQAGIDNLGAAPVDAVDNWWNCSAGPGTNHCATVLGSKVASSPWLTAPFNSGYRGSFNRGYNQYR